MRKIKGLIIGALVIVASFCLCACGNSSESGTKDAEQTTAFKEEANTVDNEETEAETEAEADGKVHYTVKVVDEAGSPVVGAMVQLCNESCFPSKTNDSGVAEFSLDEADYKASLMTLPDGYEYSGDETEFHFEDGANELTITLKTAE